MCPPGPAPWELACCFRCPRLPPGSAALRSGWPPQVPREGGHVAEGPVAGQGQRLPLMQVPSWAAGGWRGRPWLSRGGGGSPGQTWVWGEGPGFEGWALSGAHEGGSAALGGHARPPRGTVSGAPCVLSGSGTQPQAQLSSGSARLPPDSVQRRPGAGRGQGLPTALGQAAQHCPCHRSWRRATVACSRPWRAAQPHGQRVGQASPRRPCPVPHFHSCHPLGHTWPSPGPVHRHLPSETPLCPPYQGGVSWDRVAGSWQGVGGDGQSCWFLEGQGVTSPTAIRSTPPPPAEVPLSQRTPQEKHRK